VSLENLEISEPMRIIRSWIILLCCPFLSRHSLQLCPRYSARVPPCCWRTWLYATKSACLKRSAKKCPKLTSGDRLLWICLSRLWGGWHSALAIVKPETVVAWHRAAFRLFWTWKVRRGQPGRPLFSRKVRDLICKMCRENPDTLHIHHLHVRTGEPTQDRRWKIICPMIVLRSAMWCSS